MGALGNLKIKLYLCKMIKTRHKNIWVSKEGKMFTSFYGRPFVEKVSKLYGKISKITIRVNGNKVRISIPWEVANAFLPNPDNYNFVLHKDSNPENNHVDNLYWSINNGMDYKSSAEKKIGKHYKSYLGNVVNGYTIIEEVSNSLLLECNSCGDQIEIPRSKALSLKAKCSKCTIIPVDKSKLDNPVFANWSFQGEDGTELKVQSKKKFKLKCNCCEETITIGYKSYKKRKAEVRCKYTKKVRYKLTGVRSAMTNRCNNIKDPSYKRYGARGIQVCDEWLNSFECFYSWALDNGYKPGLTIERQDNNKGYNPENCTWVTKTEQARNMSTNVLTHDMVKVLKNTDWEDRTYKEIALSIGLESKNYAAVSDVLNGNTWKDVL